ncbi:MAG: DUF5317 domain-containing protein [Chloroflexi bacterium]|nr:DUF5317 domain-containing protein [Chloroflexota bacterium]
MLWAIPTGLVLGLLMRGRLEGLSTLGFRWAPLAVGGLLVQVVLFSEFGDRLAGDLGPAVYVLSTLAVLVAVARNWRLAGMAVVAVGALSNLAAITANGGFMPADSGALEMAGFGGPGDHTNSIVLANPALRPLTDIYALPAGVPLANVFSVGDVLIGLGIVVVIVAAMRRGAAAPIGTTSI